MSNTTLNAKKLLKNAIKAYAVRSMMDQSHRKRMKFKLLVLITDIVLKNR